MTILNHEEMTFSYSSVMAVVRMSNRDQQDLGCIKISLEHGR